MAGTVAGGRRAAKTNALKYGADFYARIGRKGGRNGHTGGFAADPERARIAGAKGGSKSRRGPAKLRIYKVYDTKFNTVIGFISAKSTASALKLANKVYDVTLDRIGLNEVES